VISQINYFFHQTPIICPKLIKRSKKNENKTFLLGSNCPIDRRFPFPGRLRWAFVEEGCDIIIPVGFLLADAVAAAAEANPDMLFAPVDVNWLAADNIYGSGFAIHQATYLAGYLAAGMTETGIVGVYGGINIPPVTIFMDGYVLGVQKYNEVHGTDVQVLGWDIDLQDGSFVGNFESTDDGRTMGESLLDEGADIIMPVAGPVPL